jgi:hypothetical protein
MAQLPKEQRRILYVGGTFSSQGVNPFLVAKLPKELKHLDDFRLRFSIHGTVSVEGRISVSIMWAAKSSSSRLAFDRKFDDLVVSRCISSHARSFIFQLFLDVGRIPKSPSRSISSPEFHPQVILLLQRVE